MNDFTPETFRVEFLRKEYSKEELDFLNCKAEGNWILKPVGFNRGVGIKLINNISKLKQDFIKLKQISTQIK